MRVFLTGATGYVGSAVLDALLRAGHQVTALVRDPEKAEHVARRAVVPVIGNLAVPASYAAHAETCEGVIHAGYDQSKRGEGVDRASAESLLDAMRNRARSGPQRTPFLLYTSLLWVIGKATTQRFRSRAGPRPR